MRWKCGGAVLKSTQRRDAHGRKWLRDVRKVPHGPHTMCNALPHPHPPLATRPAFFDDKGPLECWRRVLISTHSDREESMEAWEIRPPRARRQPPSPRGPACWSPKSCLAAGFQSSLSQGQPRVVLSTLSPTHFNTSLQGGLRNVPHAAQEGDCRPSW